MKQIPTVKAAASTNSEAERAAAIITVEEGPSADSLCVTPPPLLAVEDINCSVIFIMRTYTMIVNLYYIELLIGYLELVRLLSMLIGCYCRGKSVQ